MTVSKSSGIKCILEWKKYIIGPFLVKVYNKKTQRILPPTHKLSLSQDLGNRAQNYYQLNTGWPPVNSHQISLADHHSQYSFFSLRHYRENLLRPEDMTDMQFSPLLALVCIFLTFPAAFLCYFCVSFTWSVVGALRLLYQLEILSLYWIKHFLAEISSLLHL